MLAENNSPMPRSKVFLLCLTNFGLLITLALTWIDEFENIFNPGQEILHGIRLITILFVSMIITLILRRHLNKKSIKPRLQHLYIISTVLVVSGYTYIQYSIKILENNFLNATIRESAVIKTKMSPRIFGVKADSLDLIEFREIQKYIDLPELPSSAFNISYMHDYEIFLPDFGMTLSYEVPIESQIDTFRIREGTFEAYQTVSKLSKSLRVMYQANSW